MTTEREQSGRPELGPQYVDAPRLLESLFEKESRPSLRALRNWQAAGIIPHVRLGRLVFFDPAAVKAALESRRTRRVGAARPMGTPC